MWASLIRANPITVITDFNKSFFGFCANGSKRRDRNSDVWARGGAAFARAPGKVTTQIIGRLAEGKSDGWEPVWQAGSSPS